MSFQEYIDSSFPVGGKHTRSVVIRKEVVQRIINHASQRYSRWGWRLSSLCQKEQLCVGRLASGWNKRHPGYFSERKESGTIHL